MGRNHKVREVCDMPAMPFSELKCPVCKKTFVCYFQKSWAYKMQSKGKMYIFCKYSCLKTFRDQTEKRRTNRGRKKKQDA